MSARVVDRIDPFTSKATIKSKKQKRSQGSSHYRTKNAPELQALPQLKGKSARVSNPNPRFLKAVVILYRYTTMIT